MTIATPEPTTAPGWQRKMPTQLQSRLATEVRTAMASTGQTQRGISRRAGTTEANLSLMLSGQRVGSLRLWDALLRAANTPPLKQPEVTDCVSRY
jgi:hypothetical protein